MRPDLRPPPPPLAAQALRGLCGGAVLLPDAASYDAARAAWDPAVDQRPAAVAYPATAEEAAEVVRAAAGAGLRVAAQGPGHGAAALGSLADVVLLRTAGMPRVTVDPSARVATVGAGALWRDVVAAAAPYGLTARHPGHPDIGVTGYALGGGLGWYARAHGLQSSALRWVELVTAGGERVRADARHEAELFWALRGGGGNLGVVTSLGVELLAVTTVHAGALAWPAGAAARVLAHWADWSRAAPDEVTTTWRLDRVRGLVLVHGVVLGGPADADRLLAPLRALRPAQDTFAQLPAPAVLTRLAGTSPYLGTGMLLDLPADASALVDGLLAAARPLPGLELRQLGGALRRAPREAGALAAVDADLLVLPLGPARDGAVQALEAAVTPWATGRRLLGLAAGRTDVRTGYDPLAWPRLRAVRTRLDPAGLLVANHPVPALRVPPPR